MPEYDPHTAITRLVEVRRRVIRDFYDGTTPSAGHWVACHLCEWVWRYGEAELHEPSCPLGGTNA